MEVLNKTTLAQVITVDEESCVNCHACIAACPVKYCNDGSGDSVRVNPDMCIACGNCLDACTHDARKFIDDFDLFLNDLNRGEKIIAIVAPSIVASFPETYLNLNGWLKSLGVEFIFDVSFGAELTVKSYVDHIVENNPKTMIAQPCPAIVTYIELYKPELIKHLAPADSPMLHSIKTIQNHYPEYRDHKVAVVSPCMAKKREFSETGIGDYLLAIKSIDNYLKNNDLNLVDYDALEFDNPKAERAVLFSSPGGLLKTAERMVPEISERSRKIEGVGSIYEYLESLPEIIEKDISPLIVDCLNCEFGCNAGPVTLARGKSVDEIEHYVSQRSRRNREHHAKMNGSPENIENLIDKYWQRGLFKREYQNLWANVELKYPNKQELEEIFISMHKYSDADIFNCVSCGYSSCEKMAVAIFNGLNKPENCHHYLQTEKDISQAKTQKSERRVNSILETAHDGFVEVDNDFVIRQANMAFKSMVKRRDVVGRSLFEFLDEENKKILFYQRKLRAEKKKSSYELEFTQADECKITCLVSGVPMFDDEGIQIGSFAMISDITELKEAEKSLRLSHENLEQKVIERTEELNEMVEELRVSNEMIQAYNYDLEKLSIVASEIDNATIIMDPEGNFEWVNAGFTKMFGLTNDHIQGKKIISDSTPDYIREQFNLLNETLKPVYYEFELKKPDEPSRWIQVTLTPILDGDRKIKKLIAIDTDITTLKENELKIISQKEEIETQRDDIEEQRDIARKQSEDIQASIVYASRIQNALLPENEIFAKYFKEHFIIFYPKDIVSGDFYWIRERENKIYLAGADCTGHGVPGAFMSMLGITFLNEIVNTVPDGTDISAGEILNRLRDFIISSLNQTGKVGETKDGMDMALTIFDFQNNTMQFAGAHQPVLILRDDELTEIKGDKMPVGIHMMEKLPFNEHEVQLNPGDQIYMFSDGITDQFNALNKQKLSKKRFKELVQNFGNMPMKQQYLRFNTAFDVWQGDNKQIDDMLLIGVKV